MYVLLAPVLLILLFLIFRKKGNCWRSSALLAALTWGLLVTFMTEVLSIFRLLTFSSLALLWTVTTLTLVVTYFKLVRPKKRDLTSQKPLEISFFLTFLLGSVAVIVAAIALIALIAPPNNWDSMTYHMSRVVHWLQNRSVDHYPTHILRQLHSGPWAEFAITHLQSLSGGDSLANLVQWFSMLGSIIGVSLIAERLGANLRGQMFSAVACATIPMGILQASSTQTDYVTAFWLVCFVYFAFLAMQDKMRWTHVLTVGGSLGLALLTKGVAYIYAFPFCLWLLWSSFKHLGRKFWQPILAIGAIALLVNIGHYSRNFEVFGSILGASEGQGNKVFGLTILLSNIIRNLALHINTPIRSINLLTIHFIESIHQVLGIDVSDPRTTSPSGQKFDLHSLINHEDMAGNTLHLLLFVGLVIYFFLVRENLKKRQQAWIATYFFTLLAAFILFCMLVVWSPWRSRLHLPLFVLSSALIGIILSELVKPKLANALVLLMIFLAPIWVFFNESRPLIANSKLVKEHRIENIFNTSKMNQYFINVPELQTYYVETSQFLNTQTCKDIGLIFRNNTWEYPLWFLLQKNSDIQIEHVNVENVSEKKSTIDAYKNFKPCVIVTSQPTQSEEVAVDNNVYLPKESKGPLSIFVKS